MSSDNFHNVVIDKFIFQVKKDYLYDSSHIWYNITGNQGTAGITDYLQQTIGDIAFISVLNVEPKLKQAKPPKLCIPLTNCAMPSTK